MPIWYICISPNAFWFIQCSRDISKVHDGYLEKCHFMVKERIVLGHKISHARLEVDPVKIDVVSKLPLPSNVKAYRSFLGHVGLYKRSIQEFFQIAKPLSNLL